MDSVTHPDLEFMKAMQLDILTSKVRRDAMDANPKIVRYSLNLRTLRGYEVKLPEVPTGMEAVRKMDMPAINENRRHEPYCYVHGLSLYSDGHHMSNVSIVKNDLCGSKTDKMWFKRNHYPTEPLFIPDPNSPHEDGGLILSFVLNGETHQTYIAVLDARSLELVNEAILPTRVPFGLHGNYFIKS